MNDVKSNPDRRTFIKNVAGSALCFTCLPSGSWADPPKISDTDMTHLAAACGTFCGACPAYIAKHSTDEHVKLIRQKKQSAPYSASKSIPHPAWMDGILCDGCLSDGQIAHHCASCAMKQCTSTKKQVTRCSDCNELPCSRITNFINTGLLHRAEYLPNLEKIRQMGVQAWIEYETKRWQCPQCGLPMSWYDAECVGCGEPRSKRLFPLT